MKYLDALVVLALLTGMVGAAEPFKDTAGKHLDIVSKDRPLVRYMYEYDVSSPEKKHDTYKVFYHVMNEEGTDTITKGPGDKYTHHRGIFIGWSKLQHGGKGHDLWHMKAGAAQLHKEILKQEADEKKSTLSTMIHWLTSDGKTVCIEEKRTVIIHHGDKDAHLLLDFETELKAVNGDVQLKGDPEHAGFQYRPHQDVVRNKSSKYTFHKEGITAQKDKDLPWVALTYDLKDRKYTVQHMNHPANPKGVRYSAYRDYGRFGAFFEQPVKDGESLRLKYRIRITRGEAPARDVLAAQHEQFVR
jgi:hypothetical protein